MTYRIREVVPIRDVPHIWEAWRSGGQVGEMRPCSRVTVEKKWHLDLTDATVGTWTRGPARWFQREDISKQDETEIPNILSVSINRSLESDAASCDLVVANATMPDYGQQEAPPGQFGDPGALTFDHGVSQDARARWSHAVNLWQGVLTPNALIRTYQGYGGHDKTIRDAVADGNLVLTGVWLVDDVQISTDGNISLKCRDMMKLLIDQLLLPPLVPPNLYPLLYKRWTLTDTKIPKELPPPPCADYPCQYLNSSTDVYYNEWVTRATGHPGIDAFDISTEERPAYAHQATFWMSEPFGSPNDSCWIEFLLDGGNPVNLNKIYFHVFEGTLMGWPPEGIYRVMVSVVERTKWAAPEVDGSGITPQGVPFVTSFVPATDWHQSNWFQLPRVYWASLVRLTITNLQPVWEGGWRPPDDEPVPVPRPPLAGFRGGARKIMASGCAPDGPNPANICFTAAGIPPNNEERRGYWQVRSTGQIYAFGDARLYPVNSPNSVPQHQIVDLAIHPTGRGYWMLDDCGIVISAGDAIHRGDPSGPPQMSAIGIACTPDGDGYWILDRDGVIYPYGNAPNLGNSVHNGTMVSGVPAVAESITAHPSQTGYWVLWTDGHVTAHGVADHGSALQSDLYGYEFYSSIRTTDDGGGYWILRTLGGVVAKGNAPFKGHASLWQGGKDWYYGIPWEIVPTSAPGNGGYMIHRADGTLAPIGDVNDGSMFGSIGSGVQWERSPGNYKDYADIVKELLLWSGFYLKPEVQSAGEFPAVYGNIETTGAWGINGPLPRDMFDKRAVYDAIKDLRDIVGYVFYIDPEGGARFESPNWWALGNWLMGSIDGHRIPFGEMPEIDESVQLQQHSINYSGQSAYSEIILATEDPMPREEGKPANEGITQTRLVPKTAPDLRGMIHIYMRTHMELSDKKEQKVMADLIDMKMWFSRRLGQVTCAANPLIDINDQVRVIERQTGEVYIHYIRGIDTSHDIESGEFTMNLNTHWLGGGPWDKFTLFQAGTVRPQSDGYWTVTIGGTLQNDMRSGIYASGRAQAYSRHEDDSHTQDIIAMRSTPSGDGYYTLDRVGKVITYGDAVHHGQLYRPAYGTSGADVQGLAVTPSGGGYWLIIKDGTVFAFGDAVHQGNATITGLLNNGNPNFATDIEADETGGYWTLTANGAIEAHGTTDHGGTSLAGRGQNEWYVALRRTSDAGGYWALTNNGYVVNKGNAPHYGNGTPYPEDQYAYGQTWDLLAYEDNSYALLHADGSLEGFGNFTLYSPVVRYDTKYWALVPAARAAAMTDQTGIFPVSDDILAFLKKTGSPSAANAIASDFGTPPDANRVNT